ncbi:uncharacterized protein si:ch211-170d8.2 [Xyrichtys novacula]|uniref:Uncharacterized protein si:ch211-170d8.2 n=1 Tax=Xyrichtys novacula TaxID=13765 RepID=A0AAV1G6B8_XYRNO|nr:uncharacterized protein si:ch211-170d8.2 [Xyrichtys novacula]
MAYTRCFWIALVVVLSVLTNDSGVLGRAVDTLGFMSKSAEESSGTTLRTDASRRWRRGAHRHEQCAELAAPWLENTHQTPEDNPTVLQLRLRPFSPGASRGLVFPGKHLFGFVRRIYRCCQEGPSCRSVKGIQGRLRGDTDVEFLLTRDNLSLAVTRAELHLQLSNPQHLEIHPVISSLAKQGLPTRYSLWSWGDTVELRVDLLLLFQSLQEAAGSARRTPSLANMRRAVFSPGEDPSGEKAATLGALKDSDGDVWGDGVANTLPPLLELGLVLSCSQAGSAASCRAGGVHLSHTPFIALYFR